jgi:uncharacterized protein YodC (DUF2158 family)
MRRIEKFRWNDENRDRLKLACAFLDNLSEQEVLSLSQLRPLSEAGEVPEGCVRVTGYLNDGQWYAGTTHYTDDTHFADIRLPEAQPPAEKAEARGKLWEYYSRKYGVMDWGYANRQEPDPYAELKKAHAEGKAIQYNVGSDARPDWADIDDTQFGDRPERYRIKPEPLVTKPDSSPEWTPQAGDVVRLKSGGPLMTISGFRFNGDVVCRWFEHFTPHNGTFEFCCLEPATKEDAR